MSLLRNVHRYLLFIDLIIPYFHFFKAYNEKINLTKNGYIQY